MCIVFIVRLSGDPFETLTASICLCKRNPPRSVLLAVAHTHTYIITLPHVLPCCHCSSIVQVEPILLFLSLFFFSGQSWHIFSLWKRWKPLLYNLDMSMHSCRGRHVENRLMSIWAAAGRWGGWGESVTKLTSNRKVFDFSKDTKCALVCQTLKA